ncbi:MAG: SpoIIE family protein phosphatase [bacterium]|nr:SpoIIE family protein phosphatase [bacterium]
MTVPDGNPAREELLLLGRDRPELDTYTVRSQRGGATAASLSGGSSAPGPKGAHPRACEDALLVVDEGPRTLMAVCDAHFGPESSQELVERLATIARPIPNRALELFEAVRAAGSAVAGSERVPYASETTLLAAVIDREADAGFGLSFGDSSLLVIGLERAPLRLNAKNALYVSPCDPASLAPTRGVELSFELAPGELVVGFSDGIDECHYRRPATSIAERHLEAAWIRCGADPEAFVHDVTRMALDGVDGNPGGQDDIVLAASRV